MKFNFWSFSSLFFAFLLEILVLYAPWLINSWTSAFSSSFHLRVSSALWYHLLPPFGLMPFIHHRGGLRPISIGRHSMILYSPFISMVLMMIFNSSADLLISDFVYAHPKHYSLHHCNLLVLTGVMAIVSSPYGHYGLEDCFRQVSRWCLLGCFYFPMSLFSTQFSFRPTFLILDLAVGTSTSLSLANRRCLRYVPSIFTPFHSHGSCLQISSNARVNNFGVIVSPWGIPRSIFM